MKKLNLENYDVEVSHPDGTKEMVPLDVKKWVIDVLFHPELRLQGREVLLRQKLAEKIEKADKNIILEEVDYSKIKQAFETIKGLTRVHVKLLDKVFNPEDVEVKEK